MAKIRINGDTSGYIEISAPAVAGSTSITLPATTGGSLLATDANGNLNVDSGVLYVDGVNNRVGIGTTSPAEQLELSKGSERLMIGADSPSSFSRIAARNTANTGYRGLQIDGSDLLLNNNTTGNVLLATGGGRVGIGTASPNKPLQIYTGSSDSEIRLQTNSGTEQNAYITLRNSGGNLDIYSVNGAITFNPANTERLRLDTSGRVLVGTTSGQGKFIVQDTLPKIQSNYINTNHLEFGVGGSGCGFAMTTGLFMTFNHQPYADRGTDNNLTERMRIASDGTTTFQVDGVNVFRVSQSGATQGGRGRVVVTNDASLINTFTGQLTVSSNASATGGATVAIASDNVEVANTAWKHFQGRVQGGTITVNIFGNGNIQNTNGSYTAISDIKLKENIVDANSQWDDLKAIKIRNWNFKEETGQETHRQIGPIAQELEEVCPGLVFDSPDRDENGNDLGTVTKGVNQSVLYMKAVKALQEAQLRIEQLEATNASFEARLSALEVKP